MIYWLHTFNPKIEGAGVFMHQLVQIAKEQGHEVELFYVGGNLKEYYQAYQSIRKRLVKGDVLHAQYGSFCGFFTALLPGFKVLSLRGSDWYIAPEKKLRDKIHTRAAYLLTVLSLKRFDKILVMSNHMKRQIEQRFSLNNIEVIPDGIDLEKFFPLAKSVAKKELNLPEDNKDWILFSTFSKENRLKRPNLARAAVALLAEKHPNIELKIMNGIPHDKVNTFINCCDVILLTSVHEGYPNIIKEGLACGVPFVGTDVSDLIEVSSDPTSGCYVTAATPEALSEALLKVLKNKKEQKQDLRRFI
ncbi:MAG: putative teichuronic acid biosynthesis glycosyltransferase TuaC, partial [Bacteroidota bacterium]